MAELRKDTFEMSNGRAISDLDVTRKDASEKRRSWKFTDNEWHENRNPDTFDSGRESGYNPVFDS